MGHRVNKREQHTLAAYMGAKFPPMCGAQQQQSPAPERIDAVAQYHHVAEPLDVTPTRYRFEPYNFRCAVVPLFDDAAKKAMMLHTEATVATADIVPTGTLHTALYGKVSFTPYPTTEFAPQVPETDGSEETARVFIGQLPYHVTDMQLNWLCYTFGGNHMVHSPERIMKKQPNGDRLPTGCIHAYCPTKAVSALATGMHKRLLVDDTGVWYARTQSQVVALEEYVQAMKINKHKRVAHRPYDTVVVQLAHSTYVPKTQAAQFAHPAAAACNNTTQSFHGRSKFSVSPPPPSYASYQASPPAYHGSSNQQQFY